jgi:hypothetical protein
MTRTAHAPQEFEEERLAALTNFRCEKCLGRYPNTPQFLVIQDGARLCRPNCAFDHSKSEWDVIAANAIRDATAMDTAYVKEYSEQLANAPNWSLMDGVSALTDITFTIDDIDQSYPTPIPLSPGGSIVIGGNGIGFTSADTITFSGAGSLYLSISTPSISTDQTSFTTTITADTLCPLGDYDLLFNASIYRNAVRVRHT